MGNSGRALLFFASAITFTVDTASAATLDLQAYVSVVLPGGEPATQDETITLDTSEFPFATATANRAAETRLESVSASSLAAGNGDRGVLRAETGGTGQFPYASAFARLTETYSVSGAGKLTVDFKIDGWWFLLPTDGSYFDIQASVCIACDIASAVRDYFTAGTANDGFIPELNLSASGLYDTLSGPVDVQVSWEFSIFQNGPGFIDFGSTGRLLVSTDGSLTALSSDPDFLSDPAYFDNPASVPLPATGLLLIFGLAGIGFVSRRGSAAQTA